MFVVCTIMSYLNPKRYNDTKQSSEVKMSRINPVALDSDMTLEEVKKIINEETGVLLYFSGQHCNVCHALRPKFKETFDEHFPLIRQLYLDVESHPDIAAHFNVFSIPTMIVFLQGKEFAREGRAVSMLQLRENLLRPYSIMTEG